jgi:hypothetical protein
MSDGSRHIDAERLAKLREKLGNLDMATLQKRFEAIPESLTKDELDYLGLVTREAIRSFADKARPTRDSDGGSGDPASNS